MSEPHRKNVKHFHEPGHLHELTFSCCRRLPRLTNDLWRSLLAGAIDQSISRHRFALLAYVFMPEHVHLVVTPLTSDVNIPRLLADIKRPTSVEIKRRLVESKSGLLERLTIRQRPGVETFRFWQEGPGYDRNLDQTKSIELAINYIHENPVRRGLCQRAIDWEWSSARELLVEASSRPSPRVTRFDLLAGLISRSE